MIDPRPLMPSTVTILGVPYQIVAMKPEDATVKIEEESEEGEENVFTVRKFDGVINFNKERIELDMAAPDYSLLVTLIHEVIHGMLHPIGRDEDEMFVHMFSFVLLDTLRKNPELVTCLMAGTK